MSSNAAPDMYLDRRLAAAFPPVDSSSLSSEGVYCFDSLDLCGGGLQFCRRGWRSISLLIFFKRFIEGLAPLFLDQFLSLLLPPQTRPHTWNMQLSLSLPVLEPGSSPELALLLLLPLPLLALLLALLNCEMFGGGT